jgi:hypothetical protein
MKVGAADSGEAHFEQNLAVGLLGLDEFLDHEPVAAVPDERPQRPALF